MGERGGCVTGINTQRRRRALQARLCPQGTGPAPGLFTPPSQLSYTHPSDAAQSRGGPCSRASVPAGQDAYLRQTVTPTAGSLLPVWRECTTGSPRVQNPWGLDPQNTALPPAPGNPWARVAGESRQGGSTCSRPAQLCSVRAPWAGMQGRALPRAM